MTWRLRPCILGSWMTEPCKRAYGGVVSEKLVLGRLLSQWWYHRKMRRMDRLFEPLVKVKSCESCDIAREDSGTHCELESCCKHSEYDPWRYWAMKAK